MLTSALRRRGNAVVVYDVNSRQLSVRDASDQPVELTECPYCHRPLNDRDVQSEDEDQPRQYGSERAFVDPDYFAMLAASQRPSPNISGHSTPSRPVLPPALRSGRSREVSGTAEPPTGAEFVASEPSAATGQRISSSAFSPGYFKQFFREECELGRGGNGVVLLVEHFMDGVSLGHFACKRIPVGHSHTWLEKVLVEVKLLQKIPHKNIVACHWTWLEDYQPTKFGPSVPCLWILQEYCNGGDLHSYVTGPKHTASMAEELKKKMRRRSRGNASPPPDMRGRSTLSFEQIFSFFRDITCGLHHLHTKGYIHRDLKPSNCLLQRDGGKIRVLISDFGEVQAAGASRGSTGATGTISYCAPEVLQRDSDDTFGNFTTKSDIFSLGMIVYFMCFGRLPYKKVSSLDEEFEDMEKLRVEILQWDGFDEEVRVRSDLPEKLYKYLRRLLSVDPNERPSTEEILSSIKTGVAPGDSDRHSESWSPRVLNVESPARQSSSRTRKHSKVMSRPESMSSGRRYSGEDVNSRSPVKYDPNRRKPVSPTDSPRQVSPPKIEMPAASSGIPSPPQSPRLMLPAPPPRPMVEMVSRISQPSNLVVPFRIVLFFAKLLSLTVPCTPYATNQWLMFSLLSLAALDTGILRFSFRQSVMFLSIHVAAAVVAHQHGRLCHRGQGLKFDNF